MLEGVSIGLEPIPYREYYILFRSYFCNSDKHLKTPYYIANKIDEETKYLSGQNYKKENCSNSN